MQINPRMALIFALLSFLAAGGARYTGAAPHVTAAELKMQPPRRVTITGYRDHAMEPFVTPTLYFTRFDPPSADKAPQIYRAVRPG